MKSGKSSKDDLPMKPKLFLVSSSTSYFLVMYSNVFDDNSSKALFASANTNSLLLFIGKTR